ncbi:MAG: hypothetical protein ACJA1A_003055 [Saprospiraceae bacterium]|jgi:hypothetical protein
MRLILMKGNHKEDYGYEFHIVVNEEQYFDARYL